MTVVEELLFKEFILNNIYYGNIDLSGSVYTTPEMLAVDIMDHIRNLPRFIRKEEQQTKKTTRVPIKQMRHQNKNSLKSFRERLQKKQKNQRNKMRNQKIRRARQEKMPVPVPVPVPVPEQQPLIPMIPTM